jgi:hypothetical protein
LAAQADVIVTGDTVFQGAEELLDPAGGGVVSFGEVVSAP